MTIAIQSYCFRHFPTHEAVIAELAKTGADGIELCKVHLDMTDAAAVAAAKAAYAAAGVAIVSVGVTTFGDDAGENGAVLDHTKELGLDVMSVNFPPAALGGAMVAVAEAAAERGIRLGIHNHGGRHWLGNAQALDHVFARTPANLGLCVDTAWALHSHEDPLAWVERWPDRIFGVHLKDFVFDPAGVHRDVVIGTGNLDLPGMLSALAKAGFRGTPVIEYEGDVEDPAPALKECVEAIRAA